MRSDQPSSSAAPESSTNKGTSPTTRADAPAAVPAPAPARAPARAPAPAGRDPLLAAICHDLRAPLAAVTMGANFVLQTKEDEINGRSRRVLEAILRSCKQMERLVRDFGDLSEIEGDAVVLRLGVHDAGEMRAIAAEAARNLPVFQTRNLKLKEEDQDEDERDDGAKKTKTSSSPIVLRCDRERILRAIAQVVDNATRFEPEGGTLNLALHESPTDAIFAITDHGPGLKSETLAHLYDRTWHSKRADRVGAGLGLAIARGLVEAHGGSIDVESKPGKTVFRLTIPKDARPSNPPSIQ
jgi:signal transduction histidine kinase